MKCTHGQLTSDIVGAPAGSLARIIHEHVVILLKPVNMRIYDNGVRNPFDTVSFFHESRNYVPDRAKSAFAAIGL